MTKKKTKQTKESNQAKKKAAESVGKVVPIGDREFEIIGENRISARIFEALAARSELVVGALDAAAYDYYQKGQKKQDKPFYRHDVFMGHDSENKNIRASISVFYNTVIIQLLREK